MKNVEFFFRAGTRIGEPFGDFFTETSPFLACLYVTFTLSLIFFVYKQKMPRGCLPACMLYLPNEAKRIVQNSIKRQRWNGGRKQRGQNDCWIVHSHSAAEPKKLGHWVRWWERPQERSPTAVTHAVKTFWQRVWQLCDNIIFCAFVQKSTLGLSYFRSFSTLFWLGCVIPPHGSLWPGGTSSLNLVFTF